MSDATRLIQSMFKPALGIANGLFVFLFSIFNLIKGAFLEVIGIFGLPFGQ
jgi:hypothetical protein